MDKVYIAFTSVSNVTSTCRGTDRGFKRAREMLGADISGVPLARRSVIGFIRVDEKRPEYRQA